MAEVNGQGTGHEEEHGAGVDEAVGGPFAVHECGGLDVEVAEEAGETAGGSVGVHNAGVGGLPGDETEKEGAGDWEPGPEDGGDGLEEGGWFGRGRSGGWGEERAGGGGEFAEGDQADDEADCSEDGEEVVEEEGELSELGPVEAGGDAPDRKGEDPGEPDGEDDHDQIEEEALCAPCDGFKHGLGLAQVHLPWCRIVDSGRWERLILPAMARVFPLTSEVSLQRMLE